MISDVFLPPDPRFCHQCGGALSTRSLPDDHQPRLVCEQCGFIQYLNPRVVASALPEREGADGRPRLLLMRRALEPRRGYWTPPGGFVDMGESTEEAAVRECEEEVGLAVEVASLLGVYSRPTVGIVVVTYRARAPAGEPKPGVETLETRWFTPETIPWEELAFETTTRAMHDWLAALG